MSEYDIIKTKIFKSNKNFISNRTKRIEEAISFEGGTKENPIKHIISQLPTGKEVYFFKPGKGTLGKNPNVYDMLPNVGANCISETESWAFEKMWEYLIKISIINQITFKKVLVLLYRLCFFIDHKEDKNGKIRYLPSLEILDYISKLDFALKDGFKDKFKTEEIGLLEYLHFIDLLGWNEDVKYHIKNSNVDFEDKSKKNVGRVNTGLTIISAPLMISNFIKEIIDKTENKGIIDVKLITTTIQMFTKSRGICVLTNKELFKHLQPYLEN